MDKKSYDCAMWMREECGIETLKESLDYSQKQNSLGQAEIVRLKKDLVKSRDLLRRSRLVIGRLCVSGQCNGLLEDIDVELAKE